MADQEIPKVRLRGGFNDRNGIDKINTSIQTKDLDKRTRMSLINCFSDWINSLNNSYIYLTDNELQTFYRSLLREVFIYGVTALPGQLSTDKLFDKFIKDVILKSPYNDVLTLAEYITIYFDKSDNKFKKHTHIKELNSIFEKEFVGYRFIGTTIVAITDDIEKREIELSLDIKFKACKTQFQNSLRLLADRDTPDYKNSIKESISAVESICQLITENDKATLGQALKELKNKGVTIHPALESAFTKLYGYTSDEGGIRHCEGMFESNVTFEEAKFMLVSCSAFVNYLIAEYGKIKGN